MSGKALPTLLSEREAALMLGFRRLDGTPDMASFRKIIVMGGAIPYVRVSARTRKYDPAAILSFIERRTVKGIGK